MRRGNCIWFALRMWWRFGGYIIIRRSRYLWLPHVLWAPSFGLEDAIVRHYVPLKPTRSPWALWRAFIFCGRVRTDDHAQCTESARQKNKSQ